MDSVALNMSDMVYQHNYGTINIDEPEVEAFFVVHFTPLTYILQDSIEVNVNKITEGK